MKTHFHDFALYNRWANRRLYDAAAAVPEGRLFEDRGAFFRSLGGTLNHILVADQTWMRRLEGTGPQPPSLDTILHDRFDALRTARAAEDERILAFVDQLAPERLAGSLSYATMAGVPFEQPMAEVLTHVFNHQTHHRGQAHCLLTQMGLPAPELDFLYFLRAGKA